ncbi:MAG TPA: hypothetical protein VGQ59_15295 [Cyclobacteriaceae bacterium]|jgi:hypothetical protein|nr:hypothetical protein [Cyclobacteriaceae bacterium]
MKTERPFDEKFSKAAKKSMNEYFRQQERIHKAIMEYDVKGFELSTENLYQEWIGGLRRMKKYFKDLGYNKGRYSGLFLRYVMERNDFGLVEHMKNSLSKTDYEEWSRFYFFATEESTRNQSPRKK